MSAPAGAPWTIRLRAAEDLPALAEVLAAQQAVADYPVQWPLPVPVEDFLVRAREEAAWVAVRNGRPVGHVTVQRVVDDPDGVGATWAAATGVGVARMAEVAVLFVAADLRGTGVGGALLDVAVDHIRHQGRTPVLDVVCTHQEVRAYYRRRGWEEVGEVALDWLPVPITLLVLPPPAAGPAG
ncbi:GNAT family N-acetyltransferase [Iamia majanohamensis]|uniref:GNAT family N-acetyltransferase n=1 Tax=Iamia majanohamensis TaxID=467976 RepID=A0AAE9YAK5_9ACTN|nr:GNAT family N-acetyltransferase [Iamia majanohamensis]WCO67454.1 GNAT family N-acetyltransferase [Iamia majanohamensis]